MVGTIEWLDVDDLVWDYSFARPDPDYMVNRGVKAVSRYIAVPNSNTRGKIVTLDEVKRLADAGILMIINLETNPGDPLQGAPRGTTDGQLIERYRSEGIAGLTPALQFPLDLPVIASLDVGVSTAQINGPVTDYWHAINDNYDGQIGDYHGVVLHRRLLSLGLSGLHWTAGAARSWSSPYAVDAEPTHMLQLGGETGVDYNRCLRRIPVWNINGEIEEPVVTSGFTSGGDLMGGHVGWAKVCDDGDPTKFTGIYVELVRRSDGILCRDSAADDAAGVYGFPLGIVATSVFNVMPWWNFDEDMKLVAEKLKANGIGGTSGAAPTHFTGPITGTIDIKAASS